MNFQKYPAFVEAAILDMLIGSSDYQKKQFSQVIDELAWKIKSAEIERFLRAQPKNILLGYERRDSSYFTCIPTLFMMNWNHEVFHGPRSMLIVKSPKGWLIETYNYFTPSEAELVVIRQARQANWQFVSKYEDVFHHESLPELVLEMLVENEQYQSRRMM